MKTRDALASGLRALWALVWLSGFTFTAFGQGGPPIITLQPQGQTNAAGGTANFSVSVYSLTALNYQWRFNGASIGGATNSNYTITNLQAWQAGVYSVAVTNAISYIISSNAPLGVVVPAGGVIAWGNNQFGQSTVPPGLGLVRALAAGGSHSVVLKADGSVVAWGENDFGQCDVPSGLTNVTAVAAGDHHSVALRKDGTVVAWGNLSWMLPLDLSNVVAIAAGGTHSLALLADGHVFGWGDNGYGQLNAPAGLNDVVGINAGGNHSAAVRSGGGVVVWGDNDFNQTNVPGTLANVVAIAAGDNHCMALRSVGVFSGWGDNSSGQTNLPGGGVPYVAVASGSNFNLGLRNNGTIQVWGGTGYGSVSVPQPAGLTNLTAVSARGLHCLALQGSGAPVITIQPFSQQASSGDTVRFAVEAVGIPNLRYQWRLNGSDLPGATGTTFILNLTNVQVSQAGAYTAVVTNNFGMVTSAVAMLSVSDPIIRMRALEFSSAGFKFRVTGEPGICFLQISPNLTNWFDVFTTNIPPSGSLEVLDPTAVNLNQRAYRVRRPLTP